MVFVVGARWISREGEEDRVWGAIAKLIAPSRAEPGCLMYQPHRAVENPRVFYIYEQYIDEAAYEAHGASPHFQKHAIGEGIPLLESRGREFYETIENPPKIG